MCVCVDFRNVDVDRYRNALLDREALRKYQQRVNEQVLQEKNAILQGELDQRQRLLYIIVVGFIFIIFVILAAVAALIVLYRQSKPCKANLQSHMIGNLPLYSLLPHYNVTDV